MHDQSTESNMDHADGISRQDSRKHRQVLRSAAMELRRLAKDMERNTDPAEAIRLEGVPAHIRKMADHLDACGGKTSIRMAKHGIEPGSGWPWNHALIATMTKLNQAAARARVNPYSFLPGEDA